MRPEIQSQVIGTLMQSEDFDDWWEGAPVPVPLFGGLLLPVIFMNYIPGPDEVLREADAALAAFLNLSEEAARVEATPHVHRYYTDVLNAVDLDPLPIRTEADVWNHVQPKGVYLSHRHRRDNNAYVLVACDCDWEEEHGLQLVYRQGRALTRVSDQDGHVTEADAYDKPDSEDAQLSLFSE